MNTAVSVFLELLKITVPALIVFLTAYYLLKEFLTKQYNIRMLEFKEKQQQTTLPPVTTSHAWLTIKFSQCACPEPPDRCGLFGSIGWGTSCATVKRSSTRYFLATA